MKSPYFHKVWIIFLVFVMAFITCKDEEPPDEPVYRTGAVISLTGAGSFTGIATQAALELAVEDINEYLADIGSGKSITISIKDSETDTVVALQKVKELHADGIMAIIGPYSSASVAAVKNYADENGVIIVSPSSEATSLAIPDDNIYRLVPADFNQGEAMASLLDDDNVKYIVPIVRDDLWGNELLESTSKYFLDLYAGTTSNVANYPTGTSDFSQYILQMETRVQEALVQYDTAEIGIYMISFSEGIDIINAAKDNPTLKHIKWYGNSALANNEALTLDNGAADFAATHGLLCPIFGYDPAAQYKWEPLVERIEAKTGSKPDIYALCAYDELWLISLTYLSTGFPTDSQNFRYIFELQANDYFGVTGRTTLNDSGDREFAIYDFFGIIDEGGAYAWQIAAKYNNATKELIRY